MKEKIRPYFELCLALLFIASVILGYYKDISYMSEYCFISGLLTGIIFLVSAVRELRTGKRLSVWIYFCCTLDIVIILLVTAAMRLSLEGAFIFIHIVNPLLLFAYWLVFCDHREDGRPGMALTGCVFPLCYLAFAFVIWKATGSCPFPANMLLVGNSTPVVLAAAACCLAVFALLGCALYFLSRFIHGRLLRNRGTEA